VWISNGQRETGGKWWVWSTETFEDGKMKMEEREAEGFWVKGIAN